MGAVVEWPAEHSQALSAILATGLTYREAALAINEKLNTSYSRNAVLGRAKRMNLTARNSPRGPAMTKEEANRRKAEQKKLKRWAANPSLREREARLAIKRQNRQIFLDNGATTTSAGYRKQFPRQPEMSKAALRAMLTTAIQNTAAMGIS